LGAIEISNRFRASKPFSEENMELARRTVAFLIDALTQAPVKSRFNKATLFTWLTFTMHFLDYLASVCVEKQLTLVLTTHSPQMFSRLNKDQVRFSYRTDDGAALAEESQFDTMRQAVGISSPVDRIVLVEDRAAREFVGNILRKGDHSFLLRSEIIDVGGTGEISRICKSFPRAIESFFMIGAYDGDVRDEVLALKPSWPTVFLPGEKPLESTFQEIIEDDPGNVAARLGRSAGDLNVILAKIRGLDHHDWFEEFVKELHISYSELMSVCFDCWKSDARNEAAVDNFLFDLHRAADSG
jgi:hypothetical protein